MSENESKATFPSTNRKLRFLLLRVLFAAGFAFLMTQINLEYVESYLYDLRLRSKPFDRTADNIELIYITPKTVQDYKGWPSADDQELLLKRLLEAGASTVIYDFNLNEVPGSIDEKNLWEGTIVDAASVFVAGRVTPLKGEEDSLFLPDPLEKISLYPAPKTTDLVNFAKDGVTRRMILTYQGRPLLPLRVAGLYNPEILDIQKVRGRFDFYGTDQAYIDFHKARTFPSVEFTEAFQAENLKRFKDKIVILGSDLGMDESEYIMSPFNREVMALTRIELLANTIDTLIRNSGPIRLPTSVAWALILLASLLTTHIVLTLKPTKGLLILLITLVGFAFICTMIFWGAGLWVPMAGPILTILLCYYFFIPYRLIIEHRRSWEYFQKNRLLSQVEELKSNFISMMSHDLKTPIARIQGMTDMILADKVQLSSQQREAVDTIKSSSDDLLKFISAILSYGKIESEGVQLRLQSRDINTLLEEVIRKHEFLAKLKRIQVISELEPLFPVSVDADLMKQVLSNLVENAIKYSPEDTKIMVSSEETPTHVVIQVADQGPGIPTDELQNIFMKFFRSKNTKSSPIKGSGLGLYLAKYFTELHGGRIFVESSHGKGCTFTVELPIEQGGTHA